MIPTTQQHEEIKQKHEEIRQTAEALYLTGPDWITFFREILGVHGLVRRSYPTLEALSEFEQTDAYRQIQLMLTELRKRGAPVDDPDEPTRVITVRIPKSLHETLRNEAFEHRTSINKLCISKLLQFIETEKIPTLP
jgi:predicted HicB family RNase H-like nuclease